MSAQMMHPTITLERVVPAAMRHQDGCDEPGFCTRCGAEATDVRPLECKALCFKCGERTVFGAAQLWLMIQ